MTRSTIAALVDEVTKTTTGFLEGWRNRFSSERISGSKDFGTYNNIFSLVIDVYFWRASPRADFSTDGSGSRSRG